VRVIVARVGKPHGIRGEVTVDVRTDSPDERFLPGAVLHVVWPPARRGTVPAAPVSAPSELTVTTARDHNGTLLLRLEGVSDRNAAERLHGALLEADVEASGDDDAWYPAELIGLRVESTGGLLLGTVVSLDQGAAQDLLGVSCSDGVRRLVPFVKALVPVVDVAGGRIVVDAPPGLLDDGAE
jgi:16S rRNA processing protein RimM